MRIQGEIFVGAVRYRLRFYARLLMIPGFMVLLIGALITSGLRAQKPWERWFAIAIGAALLVAMFVTPVARILRKAFKPAFILYEAGFQAPEGFMIPWSYVDAAVFFNHGGWKHLGLRLREGISEIGGVPLNELFKEDLGWDFYKMPFVTMTEDLSISADELSEIFRQHGLRIEHKGSFDPDVP